MKVVTLPEIKQALQQVDLIAAIEQAFVAYSLQQTVTPAPGELLFPEYHGDTHIKYGYIKGGEYFVVKIASGFYQNMSLGLSNVQGVMLVFSQRTGQPIALLQDEGYLTNLRTAVAGQVAAKYLAPKNITKIGVIGTGLQAKFQLDGLLQLYPTADVLIYSRSERAKQGIPFSITTQLEQIADQCNLIVTTTPSEEPIITDDFLRPGMHITAIGSDTPEKQELSCEVMASADLVVTDSKEQALSRGEIAHALRKQQFHMDSVVEMGQIILGQNVARVDNQQITIADFTGIAPLDLAVADAVLLNR